MRRGGKMTTLLIIVVLLFVLGGGDYCGPALATVTHCVLFWRLYRRRGWIWDAGGDRRRVHDRLGIQTVSCGGFEFDCEHGAGGVGGDWHAGACTGGGNRAAGERFECHDRADPSLHRGDRAVLAGARDGQLVGDV